MNSKYSRNQKGSVVFIVMIVMLLSTLAVTWAARSALFNERVTGNEADYQRAFEAAQAMLADAQLDAAGVLPDGSICSVNPCRSTISSLPQIPDSRSMLDSDGGAMKALYDTLSSQVPPCQSGVCINNGSLQVKFWETPAELEAMKSRAALYGEFTGAVSSDADHFIGNPLLRVDSGMLTDRTKAQAWYWIEPLEYRNTGSRVGRAYAPFGGQVSTRATLGVVYRITAIAEGRRPGTRAVIQSVFVAPEIPVVP